MSRLADAVLLEVLRYELLAVTEEMAISIDRTARSPMLRSGDFATAVADRHGRVFGLGTTVNSTVGFMEVIAATVERWGDDFAPGDVILCNDPYAGGSHKPDIYVLMPVVSEAGLDGFAIAYSHQADVGGRFPGGLSSKALNSYEEGLHIPSLKLVEAGRRNDGLADLLATNIRVGHEFLTDVDAKVAGCRRGCAGMADVLGRYGRDGVEACLDHLVATTEQRLRAAIAAVPDGSYRGEVPLWEDGSRRLDTPLLITAVLRIDGDTVEVDLSDNPAQVDGGINMPYANTLSRVFDALHCLLGPDIPFNEGFRRPVTVMAPPGTLLNPTFPAAVSGRAPVFFLLTEAIFRALAEALPDRVPVPPSSVDVVHMAGTRAGGDGGGGEYAAMDLVWSSWGARPTADGVNGASAIHHTCMPAELIERAAPVVVEQFGLVPGSGGPGRQRGGLSVRRRYRFLEEATVMVRTNRASGGSLGLAGGSEGAAPRNEVHRADGSVEVLPFESHIHLHVVPGDVLVHENGGAGGHGPPAERDPAAVRRDVADGWLSADQALDQYGLQGVQEVGR